MADFYQTGVITTLHRLGATQTDRLEKELRRWSRRNPSTLVLPCLASEMDGPALPVIRDELKRVPYVRQIVLSLGQAGPEDFQRAREFFRGLPQELKILWNSGPAVQEIYDRLRESGVSAGEDGKGRSAWIAFGYVLAEEKSSVILLHDCDIVNYTRDIVARLAYPVVNLDLSYEYAKGYYARVTDRFHGRVTRLFVGPLVRTLQRVVGYHPLLVFLDSFRYPLAGEFAVTTDLARVIRIPGDWGLEVGVLSEVFRNCAPRRVCEVDLCETYEHKHSALGSADGTSGLMKMAVDIALSLFRTLASEGIVVSEGLFRTVKATYLRSAEDTIKKYADDAAFNGLIFDRHEEGSNVEAFAKAVEMAGKRCLEDPLGAPLISNWSRVISAIPDILERLRAAVDADNA